MFKNKQNNLSEQNNKNNPLFITSFQVNFEQFCAVMFYFMGLCIQIQTINSYPNIFNSCSLACLMATLVMGYYAGEDSRVLNYCFY